MEEPLHHTRTNGTLSTPRATTNCRIPILLLKRALNLVEIQDLKIPRVVPNLCVTILLLITHLFVGCGTILVTQEKLFLQRSFLVPERILQGF